MNDQRRNAKQRPRKGSIIVLVSVLIVVLIAMAAFTVDVAYMQMVRTELRASTDAAARAGAEALARTQSKGAAIQTAIDVAARNRVGGRSHKIDPSEVLVGNVSRMPSGAMVFAEGGTRLNAVRVSSSLTKGSAPRACWIVFWRRDRDQELLAEFLCDGGSVGKRHLPGDRSVSLDVLGSVGQRVAVSKHVDSYGDAL